MTSTVASPSPAPACLLLLEATPSTLAFWAGLVGMFDEPLNRRRPTTQDASCDAKAFFSVGAADPEAALLRVRSKIQAAHAALREAGVIARASPLPSVSLFRADSSSESKKHPHANRLPHRRSSVSTSHGGLGDLESLRGSSVASSVRGSGEYCAVEDLQTIVEENEEDVKESKKMATQPQQHQQQDRKHHPSERDDDDDKDPESSSFRKAAYARQLSAGGYDALGDASTLSSQRSSGPSLRLKPSRSSSSGRQRQPQQHHHHHHVPPPPPHEPSSLSSSPTTTTTTVVVTPAAALATAAATPTAAPATATTTAAAAAAAGDEETAWLPFAAFLPASSSFFSTTFAGPEDVCLFCSDGSFSPSSSSRMPNSFKVAIGSSPSSTSLSCFSNSASVMFGSNPINSFRSSSSIVSYLPLVELLSFKP
mmetsp:Transcript_29510/g.57544  ORF Transcript_29510/g.57544 Transcript_29510/m.57544 type:complete len:424 (-) Transcript_29510:63-1334(-)